ncbi:MAG: hypothetical protein IJ609_02640 [Paludibacteraceae bacterium]|nr:hypothetical protein [Paludibacteraceae bacterium]
MKLISKISVLFLILTLSSCSLFRGTSTTRTARTLDISSEIVQMPTVADLVVDTVAVSMDTTWTNVTFKRMDQKSAMRKVLLGQMMEAARADVIVQPREQHDVTVHHPFKQTHYLRVWGYPARFRNFRTATEADMDLLERADPQPDNYNTIYINGYSGAPSTGANTRQIAQPHAKKERVKTKKPYRGSVDLGYMCYPFMGKDGPFHGLVINTAHRWLLSKHVEVGFGTKLDAMFPNMTYYNRNSEPLGGGFFVAPYFNPRFNMTTGKYKPYFDTRVGVLGGLWDGDGDGGFYSLIGFGVELGKRWDVMIGMEQRILGDNGYTPGINVQVGVCF